MTYIIIQMEDPMDLENISVLPDEEELRIKKFLSEEDAVRFLVKHGKKERVKDYTSLLEVLDVASLVLEGVLLERTQGATHYHAYYVKPRWAIKTKRFKNLGRVGAHIFYVDKGNQ